MASLYADEQFPLPVVKLLRNLGQYDVCDLFVMREMKVNTSPDDLSNRSLTAGGMR